VNDFSNIFDKVKRVDNNIKEARIIFMKLFHRHKFEILYNCTTKDLKTIISYNKYSYQGIIYNHTGILPYDSKIILKGCTSCKKRIIEIFTIDNIQYFIDQDLIIDKVIELYNQKITNDLDKIMNIDNYRDNLRKGSKELLIKDLDKVITELLYIHDNIQPLISIWGRLEAKDRLELLSKYGWIHYMHEKIVPNKDIHERFSKFTEHINELKKDLKHYE
jgi:hypothetical protein